MNDEIKTKEDLQNDVVAFVYGVFRLVKYAIVFFLICIACYIYVLMTARG